MMTHASFGVLLASPRYVKDQGHLSMLQLWHEIDTYNRQWHEKPVSIEFPAALPLTPS
jgi:hypothetical protein